MVVNVKYGGQKQVGRGDTAAAAVLRCSGGAEGGRCFRFKGAHKLRPVSACWASSAMLRGPKGASGTVVKDGHVQWSMMVTYSGQRWSRVVVKDGQEWQ